MKMPADVDAILLISDAQECAHASWTNQWKEYKHIHWFGHRQLCGTHLEAAR